MNLFLNSGVLDENVNIAILKGNIFFFCIIFMCQLLDSMISSNLQGCRQENRYDHICRDIVVVNVTTTGSNLLFLINIFLREDVFLIVAFFVSVLPVFHITLQITKRYPYVGADADNHEIYVLWVCLGGLMTLTTLIISLFLPNYNGNTFFKT